MILWLGLKLGHPSVGIFYPYFQKGWWEEDCYNVISNISSASLWKGDVVSIFIYLFNEIFFSAARFHFTHSPKCGTMENTSKHKNVNTVQTRRATIYVSNLMYFYFEFKSSTEHKFLCGSPLSASWTLFFHCASEMVTYLFHRTIHFTPQLVRILLRISIQCGGLALRFLF